MTDGPLIVQSDRTLLLEVDHPDSAACRRAIAPFAELERAPEHVHTYRVTPLALWNARAAGHDAEQVVDALVRYSRYPVPHALLVDVADTMDRFGRLKRRGRSRVAPYVFTGIQMIAKRLLRDAPEGPFSTNILWDRAIEEGRCFGMVHQGLWFDVGTPASITATEAALANG